MSRVIGALGSAHDGPTIAFIGGVHGNEPAGAIAIARVLAALAPIEARLRGRVVGLRGNLTALARGVRYVDRDLNRAWTPDRLAMLEENAQTVEDAEQRELAHAVGRVEDEAESLVIVDLHSTSGPSAPFACVATDDSTTHVAGALAIPVLVGLESFIPGTLLSWAQTRGLPGLSIEGGQNDDPSTAANLVAACWLLLVDAGVIASTDVVDLAVHRERMRAAGHGLPRAVLVEHRHRVADDDAFVMRPGFATFDPVVLGQHLADDRHGPVVAPTSGRILMPRYQGLGEDGFFVGRDFTPAWIAARDRGATG